MNTLEFKTIGFSVCEPHFKTEAAMTTWVLRQINQTNKSWLAGASPSDADFFWETALKEEKQMVKESIGEPYEPKPWEALSHLIV